MPETYFCRQCITGRQIMQDKEGDDTFDFNLNESKNISLKDIPIRIEHEEGLAVGQVERDWTDSDGKKWILGKVHDNTLERSLRHSRDSTEFVLVTRCTKDCRCNMCTLRSATGRRQSEPSRFRCAQNHAGPDVK